MKRDVNMAFTYYLPDEQGEKVEYRTSNNAVVIIGANGAGKSKLGAWIEQQNFEAVHRIGAQRNLNFSENIPLKSYSQAEDLVFWGDDGETGHWKNTKGSRWDNGKAYTTTMLNDFDNVLAALIALTNKENSDFVQECKKAEHAGNDKPHTPVTSTDKLSHVWDDVFPQRRLEYSDAKFMAAFNKNDAEVKYSSTQMSDGERAVLYLTSQVLCIPENKTLIIDEPEVHLHRSIMNRLWHSLEQKRPDCLFIYITHDTQFAAMHSNADKIWIKEYDGQNWKLEKIEGNDLPEDLLLDILGSRKNVLFVEGEKNSYDTQLYTAIYPNYYVIPCGSCSQVIARTKSFRSNQSLHHFEVYGIIDRDYRSDYEIQKLAEDHIYTIQVAEVENLFLVEELIRLMAEQFACDAEEVFQKVKKYVINQRFSHQIEKQICQNVVSDIKFRLSTAAISLKNEEEAKASLNTILEEIDFDTIKAEHEQKFRDVLANNDYLAVLRVFNEKSLSKSVGEFFGIRNNAYCSKVVALLHGDQHDAIVTSLLPYFPTEIPR